MKVLVSSLTSAFGGVESLFLSIVKNNDDPDMQFDFVCTDGTAAREEDFTAAGSRVIHIERPSRQLKSYKENFKKLFEEGKYDIYHVNLTRYRFPLDVLIAKQCGVKVILHCHSTQIYDVGSLKYRIIRNIQQVVFRPLMLGASRLNLACSDNAGQYLFKKHPYQILHNGIDLEKFRFSQETRDRIRKELALEGKKVIGHIGRFSLEKNHRYLLGVLEQLVKEDPDYVLLSAGDGDLFEEMKALAEEKGLQEHVRLLGQRKDIQDLLSAMDVFVFPSIHEALPITLIEAQANGLPCVVSDYITKEIDVLDTITRLPLSEEKTAWVKAVQKAVSQRTAVDLEQFEEFDITKLLGRLKKLYQSMK